MPLLRAADLVLLVAALEGSGCGVSGTGDATSGGSAEEGCTTELDRQAFQDVDLVDVLAQCVGQNVGNGDGLRTCITSRTGVSGGCAACLDADVECTSTQCAPACAPSTTSSPDCIACREAHCDATFVTCSGMLAAPGTQTCAGALGGGPTVKPAERGLLPAEFTASAASQAYQNLLSCACSSSCASVCNASQGATSPPDYCNGSVALAPCASCLKATCGQLLALCSLD